MGTPVLPNMLESRSSMQGEDREKGTTSDTTEMGEERTAKSGETSAACD